MISPMKSKTLFLTLFLAVTHAHGGELYHKLRTDFESKNHFQNSSINDYRDNVMSPFMRTLVGEDASNNARPLTPKQLKLLPEAHFLDDDIFALTMAGRERLLKAGKIKNHPLVAVVDFSKNSRLRRLYIFNIQTAEVLFNTWTSHAGLSDKDNDGYAESFSNVSGSKKSSVGFMSTDVTYSGAWGYSLRLKGHDLKLNSNVLARAVVVHGFGGLDAHQASWGNVSTSEGCLMLSYQDSGRFWGMEDRSMNELIINTLKKGALVFTYTEELDTDGKELIFKSEWIKKSDVPVEVEVETLPEPTEPEVGQAVPYQQEDYDPTKEVVSHDGNPTIKNARRN